MAIILILAFIVGGLIGSFADLALALLALALKVIFKVLGWVLRILGRLAGTVQRGIRQAHIRKPSIRPSGVPLRGILGGRMLKVNYRPERMDWNSIRGGYAMFTGRK